MLRRAAALLVIGVALASCGGSSGTVATSRSTTTAGTSPRPATPTTYGGVVGAAARQACLEDARTAQQASDYYAASHGSPAPSIDALVASGILREAPSSGHGYVITYNAQTGHIDASGACTVP